MAFFSTPGIERLYSGVTNSRPCAAAISSSGATGGRLVAVVVLVVQRQVVDAQVFEGEVRG
jgi:hypothetical protein